MSQLLTALGPLPHQDINGFLIHEVPPGRMIERFGMLYATGAGFQMSNMDPDNLESFFADGGPATSIRSEITTMQESVNVEFFLIRQIGGAQSYVNRFGETVPLYSLCVVVESGAES